MTLLKLSFGPTFAKIIRNNLENAPPPVNGFQSSRAVNSLEMNSREMHSAPREGVASHRGNARGGVRTMSAGGANRKSINRDAAGCGQTLSTPERLGARE